MEIEVTNFRKIVGDRRDWRRWIEAVPRLSDIRDGERRRRRSCSHNTHTEYERERTKK